MLCNGDVWYTQFLQFASQHGNIFITIILSVVRLFRYYTWPEVVSCNTNVQSPWPLTDSITTCTVLLNHWTMSSKTMELKYYNTHMYMIWCLVSWYDAGYCITLCRSGWLLVKIAQRCL